MIKNVELVYDNMDQFARMFITKILFQAFTDFISNPFPTVYLNLKDSYYQALNKYWELEHGGTAPTGDLKIKGITFKKDESLHKDHYLIINPTNGNRQEYNIKLK